MRKNSKVHTMKRFEIFKQWLCKCGGYNATYALEMPILRPKETRLNNCQKHGLVGVCGVKVS